MEIFDTCDLRGEALGCSGGLTNRQTHGEMNHGEKGEELAPLHALEAGKGWGCKINCEILCGEGARVIKIVT